MAVVHARGAPDKVFPEFMPALYGSVYTLKFDLKKKGLPAFKVSDYEVTGVHEEEYLSRPDVKVPKTIIRYEVKKK
jgi:hypothetical protein